MNDVIGKHVNIVGYTTTDGEIVAVAYAESQGGFVFLVEDVTGRFFTVPVACATIAPGVQ